MKFLDDYSSMASEAKIQAAKGERLKILTPKEMLQRVPISLAQVKAGSNSESLLNEIRQIVFYLFVSIKKKKKKTKKVYDSIIESIQL